LPSLDTGLAGIGGALAALAVVVVAAERWSKSGSTGASVAMTAVVLGLGMAGLARAAGPQEFRAAGAGAAGIAAPALAFYQVASGGSPSVRTFAFLAGVLLASLYLTGPWRGHPFHLSILAVAGWLFGMAMAKSSKKGHAQLD